MRESSEISRKGFGPLVDKSQLRAIKGLLVSNNTELESMSLWRINWGQFSVPAWTRVRWCGSGNLGIPPLKKRGVLTRFLLFLYRPKQLSTIAN
jgi:hypothetical protein